MPQVADGICGGGMLIDPPAQRSIGVPSFEELMLSEEEKLAVIRHQRAKRREKIAKAQLRVAKSNAGSAISSTVSRVWPLRCRAGRSTTIQERLRSART